MNLHRTNEHSILGAVVDSDAKLGLLAGLAGVIVVAVVYFQKPAPTATGAPTGTALAPPAVAPVAVGLPASGEVPAVPVKYVKRTNRED